MINYYGFSQKDTIMKSLEKIKEYAFNKHKEVNHHYDDKPYSFHLQAVADVAQKYCSRSKEEKDSIVAACYCHDIIEDCRESYNDVLKETDSLVVTEIVYAVTNEKGRNRGERANEKYYEGIRNTKFASFVKLCDRVANVTYSKASGSGMFEKYRAENEMFISHVTLPEKREELLPLIECLQELFKSGEMC